MVKDSEILGAFPKKDAKMALEVQIESEWVKIRGIYIEIITKVGLILISHQLESLSGYNDNKDCVLGVYHRIIFARRHFWVLIIPER